MSTWLLVLPPISLLYKARSHSQPPSQRTAPLSCRFTFSFLRLRLSMGQAAFTGARTVMMAMSGFPSVYPTNSIFWLGRLVMYGLDWI